MYKTSRDIIKKMVPKEKKETSWSDVGKELYGSFVDSAKSAAARPNRNLLNTLANPVTIPFNAVKNYLTKKPEPEPLLWQKGWQTAKSWLGFGSGYRRKRRGRFRKGSAEAKLYMARLRAMRGSKKRTKMSGVYCIKTWQIF